MLGSLKSLIRGIVPRPVREWRADRIEARNHSRIRALPLKGKFDHIYAAGLWGRASDGTMSSGEGSRDAQVVGPYVEAMHALIRRFPQPVRLVEIGAGDFSVGAQLRLEVAGYVACDISSVIVEQNRRRFAASPKVAFHVLDAVEDPLPPGDVVTIRQVLQHLSNAQIARIVPKLADYAAVVVTEAVPIDEDFTANADHQPGFSTRVIESHSGVDLALAPFHLPHVQSRVLCEPATGKEEIGSRIRTTLYVTEKGRAAGLLG